MTAAQSQHDAAPHRDGHPTKLAVPQQSEAFHYSSTGGRQGVTVAALARRAGGGGGGRATALRSPQRLAQAVLRGAPASRVTPAATALAADAAAATMRAPVGVTSSGRAVKAPAQYQAVHSNRQVSMVEQAARRELEAAGGGAGSDGGAGGDGPSPRDAALASVAVAPRARGHRRGGPLPARSRVRAAAAAKKPTGRQGRRGAAAASGAAHRAEAVQQAEAVSGVWFGSASTAAADHLLPAQV